MKPHSHSGRLPLPLLLVLGIQLISSPALHAQDAESATVPVDWTIEETEGRKPVPCRIHLADSSGKPVRPAGFPFWNDHFVCDGHAAFPLPAGRYTFAIERGPEYDGVQGSFQVDANSPLTLRHTLRRITRITEEGWWSGDLHVHRPLPDIELLLPAEDLHVAPVITWWNSRGPWASQPVPTEPWIRMEDGPRFYAPLAGEDERGGGALLYFGLPQPLPLDRLAREHPHSATFLHQAKATPGTWVDIEKPFWWDTPVWLATGLADSVGIAHNHLHRGGTLDNEAWGRPRDREQYPPPWGNGLYTQDLYYRILNAGLRLPPSAGSASGVLPNPVGYNRAWVHIEGELTWSKWWEGLRAGRVFVSNGPLLRARANGELPGHTFQSDGPFTVVLDAKIDSREPIRTVELVRDGRVETVTLPATLRIDKSGWLLVRAIADVTHTLRFASTGPWYVEIDRKPARPDPDSVAFFQSWLSERHARINQSLTNAAERAEALKPVEAAKVFWAAQAARATVEPTVTGRIIDATTREPIPARIYIQHEDGRWFFPESADPAGSAIRYEKRNWINTNSVEFHTTLSAHPFRVALPPGRYRATVERGKEYRPLVQPFEVTPQNPPVSLVLPVERWVNMVARNWFSGDTHVHRSESELPNLLLAEDLNVAFPLSQWVTQAFQPPTRGDKNASPPSEGRCVNVDPTHAFWNLNTEYEIFTIGGRPHTLGAVFVLGHTSSLTQGAPPVSHIARHARREGALLDLDKHNWPWSMALIPVLGVDLFELANNHNWRTGFAFTDWATPAPAWMQLPDAARGGERNWTEYSLRAYYALLDCGFRLRPSAGTANGVHPVPLGFSRVYVHLPEGFSYPAWLEGLRTGNTFVTTGPMLLVNQTANSVSGVVLSETPVKEVEIIANGDVVHRVPLNPTRNNEGAWEARFVQPLAIEGTRWVATRCWEENPSGRHRFAHSAPAWTIDPARPLRPRLREVEFLVQSVRDELTRSRPLLPPEAVEEYESALQTYEAVRKNALRDP
ncbi:MAG: hypothetical protein AB7J34_11745 [Limisphaerales bacterium]